MIDAFIVTLTRKELIALRNNLEGSLPNPEHLHTAYEKIMEVGKMMCPNDFKDEDKPGA